MHFGENGPCQRDGPLDTHTQPMGTAVFMTIFPYPLPQKTRNRGAEVHGKIGALAGVGAKKMGFDRGGFVL